jgi:hypothetical protein
MRAPQRLSSLASEPTSPQQRFRSPTITPLGARVMARKTGRAISASAFLAILLTALFVSAVLTRTRAQTPPVTTPPGATAEPATPQNATPVTPRSEAEASCRAIGNDEQRAKCLAEINPAAGPTPPPPAELPRKNDATPVPGGAKPN